MAEEVEPVFILSAPRSGSTLLQRALASHPEVSTSAEPWLLLPFVYTLRREGVRSEYGHRLLVTAIEDFAAALPEGIDDYHTELRHLAQRLYAKAADPGARYFVDKTPRYGLIASELRNIFPDAKLIFLWRNPLAIVSSMIETWGHGKWGVYRNEIDLTTSMFNLIALHRSQPDNALSLRYEDLVTSPNETLRRAFRHLELDFDERILDDIGDSDVGGRLGDKEGLARYSAIDDGSLDRWQRSFGSPLRKAWMKRYLRRIGVDRLQTMGYDLESLLSALAAVPSSPRTLVSDAVRMTYGRFRTARSQSALGGST